MGKNHSRKPLYEALTDYAQSKTYPFHTPGHKQGRSMDQQLKELFGSGLLRIDLTEVDGLDNLHQPEGAIEQAQELVADLMGAKESWFIVGGEIAAYYAALSALLKPGDCFLADRHISKDIWSAAILGNFTPILLPAVSFAGSGLFLGTNAESVRKGFELFPEAKAAVISGMTESGLISNIKGIRAICSQLDRGLIVDESENPLAFLFNKEVPSALDNSADLVIHARFPVTDFPAQGGYLHRGTDRVASDRIQAALQIIQSTSPSYLIMSALDNIRYDLWQCGSPRMHDLVQIIQYLKQEIKDKVGLRGSILDEIIPADQLLDPMKLVFCFHNGIRPESQREDFLYKGRHLIFNPRISSVRVDPAQALTEISTVSANTSCSLEAHSAIVLDYFKTCPATVLDQPGQRVPINQAKEKKLSRPVVLPGADHCVVYPGEIVTEKLLKSLSENCITKDIVVEILREV